MAIVIAAATSPSAPATTDAVQPASVSTPVVAAAPSRRQGYDQQSFSVQRSAESAADEAIQQQLAWRVLMPALAGDGGG